MSEFDFITGKLPRLPVLEMASRVNECLAERNSLVIIAPPGAGKSTILPLTILSTLPEAAPECDDALPGTEPLSEGALHPGKILILEPRRLAARQVAHRMASLLGEPDGRTVGYRMRFESRTSAQTRVEVITEGILSRLLLDDPALEGVSVIIFDEFHERSLASDEALALVRSVQKVLRPDLRVVVMSATIDAGPICRFLDAPLLESRGRMFPVDVRWADADCDPRNCVEEVARAVARACREAEGDVLAFLPGESEIRRCASILDGRIEGTDILPLYSLLPFDAQCRAVEPSKPGRRKVVLATSVAETSITIEGVKVVVDCGLRRTQVFDPQSGQSHLDTLPVSLDMADQRAGRAGRTCPGVCYRLYREASARMMKASRTPEILETDLVPLALDLALWGDADSLEWLTPPQDWKLAQARMVIASLGATDSDGRITPLGRRLAKMPCHPRLAAMLDAAASERIVSDSGASTCDPSDRTASDCCATTSRGALAADLCAILEDRDPFAGTEAGTDIDLRVCALRAERGRGGSSARWNRTIAAARQYRAIIGVAQDDSDPDPFEEGALLASAYPERVGKSCADARYQLAGGEIVRIDREDPLGAEEWIVAASANVPKGAEGRIFLAARLRASDLLPRARVSEKVEWNTTTQRVEAVREWRVGGLLIESKPLRDVPQERLAAATSDAVRRYGESLLDWNDDVALLQRRVAAVAGWHPELGLPDLSTVAVLERAGEWLPLFAGSARSAAELKRIDLCAALWSTLSYEQAKEVERLAPSHISVPSGSSIRVEYRQGADAPVLRVRLQECFGLVDTPRVDDGRRSVLMELLSPGFKPVQLTNDLASFWSGTYFEVRKELRRRYPKHSWPDNPLEASAVRGVSRKK